MKKDSFSFIYLHQLLILLSILFASHHVFAKEQPIQIEADKMTAVEKSQAVIFTGNVDATQGDVRIRSDKMTVFYVKPESESKKKAKDAQQVKKIVCVGNVEVTNAEWLGTSKTMNYISKKKLVQLMGDAKAYQGQNMVQGERIDYHLETGQSEVFGSKTQIDGKKTAKKKKGRVNMTILEQ